jgi:tetratricopeptide (TPR) repeat protein
MRIMLIFIMLISVVLFSKTDKLDDNKFEILLLKASNSLSIEDYKSALGNLEQALLNNVENPDVKLYLSILLTGSGRYLNSLVGLLKTKELEKKQLAEFYKYYNYYFLEKKLSKESLDNFKLTKEFLLKNNNELTKDKLLFLSVTTYLSEDKDSSIFFFKKAIKNDENLLALDYEINMGKDIVYDIYKKLSPPYDFYYYNSLGKLQSRFKDYKKAIKTLEKALSLDKNNFLSKKLIAEAYLALEDFDNALKYFFQIKDFYNDNEELYLNISKVYLYKKDYKNSLAICKEGLDIINYSKNLRYCVANGYYKNKQYRESLYNLEYLIEQFPDSFEINLLLGNVLEAFKKEISLESDEYKRIAMGVNMLKKFKSSVEYYSKAFEIKPIDQRVTKKLFMGFFDKAVKDNEDIDDLTQMKAKTLANDKFLEYYEPFIERETLELNNIEFHKKFIKYLETKSDSLLKDMGYLPIGKTMLLYLSFLKKQDDVKLFDKFMKIYSTNYIKIFNKKHHFNQFLYEYHFEKAKRKMEELKIFDFIIPSYFD